jgi:hypothetical protein
MIKRSGPGAASLPLLLKEGNLAQADQGSVPGTMSTSYRERSMEESSRVMVFLPQGSPSDRREPRRETKK